MNGFPPAAALMAADTEACSAAEPDSACPTSAGLLVAAMIVVPPVGPAGLSCADGSFALRAAGHTRPRRPAAPSRPAKTCSYAPAHLLPLRRRGAIDFRLLTVTCAGSKVRALVRGTIHTN